MFHICLCCASKTCSETLAPDPTGVPTPASTGTTLPASTGTGIGGAPSLLQLCFICSEPRCGHKSKFCVQHKRIIDAMFKQAKGNPEGQALLSSLVQDAEKCRKYVEDRLKENPQLGQKWSRAALHRLGRHETAHDCRHRTQGGGDHGANGRD